MTFEVREAKEEDREQSIQLLVKTFGDMGILEDSWVNSWREYMNRPENHDWNFVATLEDKVIANLAYFENRNNVIRGNSIPFAGVWAVAVAEEHRRKGILTEIYMTVFKDMKDKGIALSILEPSPYPGAQLAYEKLGYALAETYAIFEFPPDALRSVKGKSSISVRELTDTKEHTIVEGLAQRMAQYGSRVFVFPWVYMGWIKQGNFYVFEEGNKPVGCMWLVFEEKDDTRIMNIYSNYLTSFEALPSAIELVKQKSDGCNTIRWSADPQYPIPEFIQNIQKLNRKVSGKMMMRIIDFENYCKSIKVPKQRIDAIRMKLIDAYCSWNEGVYSLSAENGELQITKLDDNAESDIVLDPYSLSQVIGGRTSATVLREIGIINCTESIARKLDTLFPTENFISYFRF